jgi:hypothetical protein
MTRTRLITLAALAVACALPATAQGADHNGTVTFGGPAFKWDSDPMTGFLLTSDLGDQVECDDPGKDCDDTLLKVDSGALTIKISSVDPQTVDMDLYVYPSNAQGQFSTTDPDAKSSAGSTADEEVTYQSARAGYYLARVVAATASDGTYHGEAVEPAKPRIDPAAVDYGVDPANPGAGNPSAGKTTRANDIAPTTTARALRNSQSRVLSGTARDVDGKVSYVDIALVRVLSKSCRGLTTTGTWRKLRKCKAPIFLRARGTTRWHYTLRHRLAKGTYVLFARATDNFGRAEGGFGSRNRVRFVVK